MSCICTTLVTILVNGTRTKYFKPSRDIRQGDPMSSYIIILCIKVLAYNIDQDLENRLWVPIRISKRGPTLTHLFFAHDLVLMTTTDKASC